jgi:hypothetical protein
MSRLNDPSDQVGQPEGIEISISGSQYLSRLGFTTIKEYQHEN